jgi:hypothetical protein
MMGNYCGRKQSRLSSPLSKKNKEIIMMGKGGVKNASINNKNQQHENN